MPIIGVSPYHLTTREPPAIASLQLGDGVVTLLPTPPSGRRGEIVSEETTRAAVDRAPGYLRFMESWRWAMPLFREGVLGSTLEGEDVADDVERVWMRIRREDRLAGLRPLMRPAWFDDDTSYLAALSLDLLRGGPDPSVNIPVAAGLDVFAARHGACVARSPTTSMVQRIESTLWERLFTIAVPALIQGSADRLLEARELFESALYDLRRALDDALLPLLGGAERDATIDPVAAGELRSAAGAYTDAFEDERELLLGTGPDDDEVRPVAGLVSVTAVRMSADASLRASASAAKSMRVGGGVRSGGPVVAEKPEEPAGPAPDCVSLIIKPLGKG